jgi:hypothetical protein
MTTRRRIAVTPATAISLVALFFALGGSAFAVGERVHGAAAVQQRCTNGAVRGVATVTGSNTGMANIPDQFSSAANLFSRRFNCTGRAIQVRRTEIGVYEVRFPNNTAPSAVANGVGLFSATAETMGPGLFRVRVQNVGRADEDDGAFTIVLV